jgi:hypothetical protein
MSLVRRRSAVPRPRLRRPRRRRPGTRLGRLLRGWLLLLVVLTGPVALAGCGGQHDGRPVPVRSGPLGGGAVVAPTGGAYLGAWVRPVPGTQAGRVASVTTLQG